MATDNMSIHNIPGKAVKTNASALTNFSPVTAIGVSTEPKAGLASLGAQSRAQQGRRLIRRRKVREMFDNISDVTLDRWIAEDRFPRPIIISRLHFFDLVEIDEYLKGRRS